MGEFGQCLTELSAHNTIMVGYYSLTFLFANFESRIIFFINFCQTDILTLILTKSS